MIQFSNRIIVDVATPPAVILDVTNFMVRRFLLPDQAPFIGIILELQHPELTDSHFQLHRIDNRLLRDMAVQFEAYSQQRGPST